jgi:hypothetical protein
LTCLTLLKSDQDTLLRGYMQIGVLIVPR